MNAPMDLVILGDARQHRPTCLGPRSISLSFDAMKVPAGYVQFVEVRDTETGELLLKEQLRATSEWLAALGFQYLVGSNGQWVRG